MAFIRELHVDFLRSNSCSTPPLSRECVKRHILCLFQKLITLGLYFVVYPQVFVLAGGFPHYVFHLVELLFRCEVDDGRLAFVPSEQLH